MCVILYSSCTTLNVNLELASAKYENYKADNRNDIRFDQAASDACGEPMVTPQVADNLYNNSEAKAHSWPWQVSITVLGYRHVCSGSILSKRWVVTSANCVYVFTSLLSGLDLFVNIDYMLDSPAATL